MSRSPPNLSGDVKFWQRKLGIRTELRFNDLRGTAATVLYNAGLALADLALFMGWTEQTASQMLATYARQDPNRAREIKRKIEEYHRDQIATRAKYELLDGTVLVLTDVA